jgi:hypothetical protein
LLIDPTDLQVYSRAQQPGARVRDWPEDQTIGTNDLTEDLQVSICTHLASGEGTAQMLAALRISASVFWRWHATRADFVEQVAAARLAGLERMADEIIEIAEERSDPRHRQVRIDARKWLLSRLLPRKYGDKTQVEVTQTRSIEEMTDEQLYERIRTLECAAGIGPTPAGAPVDAVVH